MPHELAKAISYIKQRKWVDLTHAFGPDTPHFEAFNDATFETLFNHDEGFFAQQFSFAGQYGTHIDAPIHFIRDTRYIHELTLKELILPLIVIDVSKEVENNHHFTLSIDDLFAFEKIHGKIEPNTFVALRTDWSKRWPDKDAFNNKDEEGNNQIPGWGMDALQFLFEERKIQAIGHETYDTDSAMELQKHGALIGEYYVLDQDTYQIELMANLDRVPAKGAYIFNIVAKPENASGFPVRSFAILPEAES
ncbi:cyclase family protein [Siminovitchia sp. FSL H7-0308]|uniref:cyclase family protein n=1 Tax=unclassified Siminovitchia TaxID=2837530 RepID=UPI0030CC097B